MVVALSAVAGCSDSPDGEVVNNCVGGCEEDSGRALFGPKDDGDWTSFRNGPYRTGYGSGSTVGEQVEVVWSRESFMELEYGAAKPSPAVWGDALYYPTDSGTMYAFDRMSGEVLWSMELISSSHGIHSSPAVTKSTVLIGTYRGHLHCLDRSTGEQIWRYAIGNVIGSSPVYVWEHNAIYVSHEIPREAPLPGGGYVTKNDPRTGEPVWRSDKLRHWPHASVAVDPQRNIVVVGANDGVFHAYRAESGEELWSRDFEPGDEDDSSGDIKTTAAISASRGLVMVGTWDHKLYALDIESGETDWTYDTGGRIMGSAAIDDENGRVFVGSLSPASRVVGLDLDSGDELWTFKAGAGVMSSPALSGDREVVVIGSNAGNLHAIDAGSGEGIWSFEADGPITASPALVGDMIYVAAKEGSLYALRTHPPDDPPSDDQ
jgi:outer membrane protein assembly factor BamB